MKKLILLALALICAGCHIPTHDEVISAQSARDGVARNSDN